MYSTCKCFTTNFCATGTHLRVLVISEVHIFKSICIGKQLYGCQKLTSFQCHEVIPVFYRLTLHIKI